MCIANLASSPPRVRATNGPLTLFVEDEVLIGHMMEDALAEAGFSIEMATSAEAAIEMLDRDHVRFATVVTDIGLAGQLTGWDVARHARELNPEIPIVYATGDHAAEWSVQGVPRSVLVSKPYAAAQVVTAISTLLNAGTAPV